MTEEEQNEARLQLILDAATAGNIFNDDALRALREGDSSLVRDNLGQLNNSISVLISSFFGIFQNEL